MVTKELYNKQKAVTCQILQGLYLPRDMEFHLFISLELPSSLLYSHCPQINTDKELIPLLLWPRIHVAFVV